MKKSNSKTTDAEQMKSLNHVLVIVRTIAYRIAKFIQKRMALILIFCWFMFMWSWSLFTDSIELTGSKTQGLVIAFITMMINVLLSCLIIWTFIRVARYVHRTYGLRTLLVTGIPLFALGDFLVAWLVALLWIGPQGSLDNVLPMGSPSLLLVNSPFRFASRLIGMYGLAAFVWFFAFLLYERSTRKWATYLVMVLSVVAFGGWVGYRGSSDSKIQAVIVSEKLKERVPQIDTSNVDLVVFPEYGLDGITSSNMKQRLTVSTSASRQTYFVGSEQVFMPLITGHNNNMLFGNNTSGIVSHQDKHRLIPGGEDLPHIMRAMLKVTGRQETIGYFDYARSVIKGQNQLIPFYVNQDLQIAAAVCSSIISPQDYRDFAQNGATLFTNSASLGTFKGSSLFTWEQTSLAKFMAVANNRYFLQSANAATSYAIDSDGVQYSKIHGVQTRTVTARTNKNKTLYTIVGEWLVYMGVGAVLLLIGASKYNWLRSWTKKKHQ